ncbi:MAG TPA: hypothetical protein VFC42_04275 [Methylomirabilota bacterium]|nr:hypothetical protein [Methylomirabilota bacterium]
MTRPELEWEILGIRQLAATDECADEFAGTLLVHRPGSADPLEPLPVRVKRTVLVELETYLARLLARSRGRAG